MPSKKATGVTLDPGAACLELGLDQSGPLSPRADGTV